MKSTERRALLRMLLPPSHGRLQESPAQPLTAEALARRIDAFEARLAELTVRAHAAEVELGRAWSRRIHDDLGQILVALSLEIHRLAEISPRGDSGLPRDILDTAVALAEQALHVVRTLSLEMREPRGGRVDVTLLLRRQFREFSRHWGLRRRFVGSAVALDSTRATVASAVMREALTNVIRHAQATAVSVRIERRGDEVRLSVLDNGRGVPPGAIGRIDALGLRGMRERADSIGGTVTIAARSPRGTVVTLAFPFRRGDA